MEISFEKKKLLKSRIKELQSQLNEKSFILTTLKHKEASQTQEKNTHNFSSKQNFFIFNNIYTDNKTPSKHVETSPNLKKFSKINFNSNTLPNFKRIHSRALSTGRNQKLINYSTFCDKEPKNDADDVIIINEYKIKIEKLKQKMKTISEKFVLEIANKDKEILELKKIKTSYNLLLEKMKFSYKNNKNDLNNDQIINSLNIENEHLKEEINYLRKNLEEKDLAIGSHISENKQNKEKIEKLSNKLKYLFLVKQTLENQLQISKEKSFQTNILMIKLENDIKDKVLLIDNLKSQLKDECNISFEKTHNTAKNVTKIFKFFLKNFRI